MNATIKLPSDSVSFHVPRVTISIRYWRSLDDFSGLSMYRILLLTLFLQGCTSNLYVKKDTFSMADGASRPKVVYVINPNHNNMAVLKKSEIFQLSEESAEVAQLELLDTPRSLYCGNGLIGPLLTLGVIPGGVFESEEFIYTITENHKQNRYSHHLNLWRRVSIWEWFAKPFTGDDVEVKAQALKATLVGQDS